MKTDNTLLRNLRITLGVTLAFWAGAVSQGYALARDLQVSWGSPRWMIALILGLAGVLILSGLLALTWSPLRARVLSGLGRGGASLTRLRPLHLPLMILFAGIFPLFLLPAYPAPVGDLLSTFFWRAFPYWLATVAGAVTLHARATTDNWWTSLGKSALIYGVVYRVAVFLPDISNYPFTLYWSEGSRYYYASLFYAEQVYGTYANPTVLHPTRYWMQSLPFLISGLPLWVHRAWQVGLWLVSNGLAAWLVVRRVLKGGSNDLSRYYVALWAFLFLFQGPIWYHLVVMVILVAWGTDTARFWKTLLVVAVASAWGGVSRVNLIPFPAVMAGMIYLLEREKGATPLWRYLSIPVVWGLVGGVAGLAAQMGYVQWSGNDPDQFGSAFSSDLLWFRLFPSATYPLGVIPAIALASLPVIWLGWVRLRGQWGPARLRQGDARLGNPVHPIRWLGVAGAMGVFFAGGLIVSAKIGGGSNLHNMDGFLALLLVAVVYAGFGKIKLEPGLGDNLPKAANGGRVQTSQGWLVGLVILIPVLFALEVGRSYDYDFMPAANKTRKALETIQEMVAEATAHGGEVLFISERQLVTFGLVEAGLVENYEKIFMMEMAMANHPGYLGQFEEDLRAHRFALIITVPVQANVQDMEDQFGEENNAWVEHVNMPLACYYQQKDRLKEVRVEVLEPRDGGTCPAVGEE
ncbi:MAG: hypothetical protein HUU38_10385 [Anaerolineales bacterium]|nr:hypothetical protein [Anaerolineales bacterium]